MNKQYENISALELLVYFVSGIVFWYIAFHFLIKYW